jgi:hypothetical protein
MMFQNQMIDGMHFINVSLKKHLQIGRAPNSFVLGTRRRVNVRGVMFHCPKQKRVAAVWDASRQEYVALAKEC